MRKLFVGGLLALAMLVGSVTTAQAQCAGCFIFGYILGSSTGGSTDVQERAATNGEVIYVLPRLAERINDPLDIRVATTGQQSFEAGSKGGWSFQDLFNELLGDKSDKYTVLRVKEVLDPQNPTWRSAYWFYFIENEKLKPLDLLPPPQ